MKQYNYFVSYVHESGFGRMTAILDHKIISIDDIAKIEKIIAKIYGLTSPVVMFYQELGGSK